MPRALCIFGMVIAILLLALFAIDLLIEFLSGGAAPMMNYGFIVASLILGYVSLRTFREHS